MSRAPRSEPRGRPPQRRGGARAPSLRPRQLDCWPEGHTAPILLHIDDDLLVVDKPAGWLTHADGQRRRPDVHSALSAQYGPLGVHSRLDIDTTGVLAFSRNPAGAARLQAALADRRAEKRYLAVVDAPLDRPQGRLCSPVGGQSAETDYTLVHRNAHHAVLELRPRTGRTHQIRAQLAAAGRPLRGDARYGDALDRRAPRAMLHSTSLRLPDGLFIEAPLPADFQRFYGRSAEARAGLRADPHTDAWRELDGAHDGWPGYTVDRYGDWLWVEAAIDAPADAAPPLPEARGVCWLQAQPDRSRNQQPPPQWRSAARAPEDLYVREHGVAYRVTLDAQRSTGLFLDQRPQRDWLRTHAGGLRVLNLFAHAGAFSVAAAVAGAETVSVDLSARWLEFVPQSLAANGLSMRGHDCIYGDVFDWLRRLVRRQERFDLVILDPPSTSVGTHKKRWSAARDYPELVALAAPLVAPGGAMWTSTNHQKLSPARFAHLVHSGLPEGAQLERVAPPAVDMLPLEGPAAVKNFVWRWPV